MTSTVADRMKEIEGSITLTITALAKQMKKEGIKVLSFSAGEPDFATPKNIQDAGIKAIKEGRTGYTPATGIMELKEVICQKLKKDNNLDYKPENIVVSCGAKHSIFNALFAIINPGDEVIVPSPYWVSYPHQVRLCGGRPVFLTTDASTGFKVKKEQLQKIITPKTKAIFLNSPSNPTGAVYTKSDLEEIAGVLLENKINIISDEIYEKLVYEGTEHISIASFSNEIKEQTIVVNGVSKAYSMTGWRIGYLAANLEITKAISKIQGHTTSNPTTPAQWASVEALLNSESDVLKMREQFNERRKFMLNGLNNINGLTCNEPQGAFYAFPDITVFIGKKCKSGLIKDSVDLCKFLLQEAHVACVPGAGFGQEGYLRLSYAASLDDIKEGLSRIENWLNSLN
ncbi:pyridoxal phosphate-dependent aminotransferase [Candidatus Margulisiibacteriota bacterium]